jgi:Skp family chaperone for outer membrane proteins
MKILKNLFFILIFSSLSINVSQAENKVFYIDVDYVLTNTLAGKLLLNTLKKEEELKINQFKLSNNEFKNKEKKILAKKKLISQEEIDKQLKLLQFEFQEYRKEKKNEIDKFNQKKNRNILNFLKLINPIIEKYMVDNSISILLDKKNVFIASKDYEITYNLIELIDNQIKTIEIK